MVERSAMPLDDRELDDAALEALADAYATTPPTALRDRLLAEARCDAADRRARRASRIAGALGALAACLVLAGAWQISRQGQLLDDQVQRLASLASDNTQLGAQLEEQRRSVAGLREALDAQARVLRMVAGPRTLTAALAPRGKASGSGAVIVDAASGDVAVIAAGLGPAGADRVYELWAVRGSRAPEPAGLFAAETTPTVAHLPRLARPGEVTAFAVSIEPAGGSPKPTGPIVLAGPVAG
jgi:hypothetical protein